MQPAERTVHSANSGAERVKQRAVGVEEDEDAGFQRQNEPTNATMAAASTDSLRAQEPGEFLMGRQNALIISPRNSGDVLAHWPISAPASPPAPGLARFDSPVSAGALRPFERTSGPPTSRVVPAMKTVPVEKSRREMPSPPYSWLVRNRSRGAQALRDVDLRFVFRASRAGRWSRTSDRPTRTIQSPELYAAINNENAPSLRNCPNNNEPTGSWPAREIPRSALGAVPVPASIVASSSGLLAPSMERDACHLPSRRVARREVSAAISQHWTICWAVFQTTSIVETRSSFSVTTSTGTRTRKGASTGSSGSAAKQARGLCACEATTRTGCSAR